MGMKSSRARVLSQGEVSATRQPSRHQTFNLSYPKGFVSMSTIRNLISYLPVVLLVNLVSSAGNATTVATFSFTQGGYNNAGILSGTFTGTVNSLGFIDLADLSNFSDTFKYDYGGGLMFTASGYLMSLSLFSFNAQSLDSASLGFKNQVGLLYSNVCVGAPAAYGLCGGSGKRGAIDNAYFTNEAPVVTLVSSSIIGDPIASGVPEPSTWAMMLLGFAGLGFMAYRRKSKPALMAA